MKFKALSKSPKNGFISSKSPFLIVFTKSKATSFFISINMEKI